MNRSVKSASTPEKLAEITAWFGSPDWGPFMDMDSFERAAFMENRFRGELGYKYAKAFPMRDRGNSGTILFWLIHASDHPRAIPLMAAAFNSIGLHVSDEKWKQFDIEDYLKRLDG